MKIFVTGTDTHVGKTLVSSWLCLHRGYDYFKPIQTGCNEPPTDSETVRALAGCRIHPEAYRFEAPLSPHEAARLEKRKIHCGRIILPECSNLIIEGAGGLMVPIHDTMLMIDLVQSWQTPVILVARSTLGTINHTLLSLEALRARNMPVLGVVVTGPSNPSNCAAIQHYGKIPLLAEIPYLLDINQEALRRILPGDALLRLMHEK